MFIALLGRQPEISIAELEAVFSQSNVRRLNDNFAQVESDDFDIDRLGGSLKCGLVIDQINSIPNDQASLKKATDLIIEHYSKRLASSSGKVTLGISAYNLDVSGRQVQKIGLILKSRLKKAGTSLRLIPNDQPDLSTATSHHNKLGRAERKIEIIVLKTSDRRLIIAESRGTQNITAYTIRDRHRPKRDAFVGMLPPKLAQIMINLATKGDDSGLILDPFCGTGTVLQEALLIGLDVTGSDLSQKMVDYTAANLDWLKNKFDPKAQVKDIKLADATTAKWQNADQISAVVCEAYLGQPFSAPPSPDKLKQVVGNCNHIISEFLTNIHSQLAPQTPLCIAVPAWQSKDSSFTHLPLIRQLEKPQVKIVVK
ncbi:hypothetical protein CR969_01555 [Candidatus Saccharibacteria bacterium]|nr:MAG: hypothetical protein CR969_01555 [Candidatus Saccharibacteria bacterium]